MNPEEYILDPYTYLKNYAQENNLDIASLDFEITDYKTIIPKAGMDDLVLNPDELDFLNDDEEFLAANGISQRFQINVVPASNTMCDFRLAADKGLLRAAAVFYASQCDVDADEDLIAYEIKQNIMKKCIKAGILIGVRSSYNDKSIKTVIDKLRNQQQKIQLNISTGVAACEGSAARIVEHFKKRSRREISRERGFMYSTSVNDLLVEYIFATPNKDGRNITGDVIKSDLVRANREVPFKVGEGIKEVIGEKSVKYFAMRPGFVSYQSRDGMYTINDEMTIQKAGFKETGSIDGGGIDTNVTLNINESNALEDAVGPNVTLNIAKLKVAGSVAQNAVVHAGLAEIGGQTHSKSKVFANEANIATHRGYVKASYVEVQSLEGGIIEANKVKVVNALGGKIMAKEIEIENALGNTICEASRLVRIINCCGENTQVIMTIAKDSQISSQLEKLQGESLKRAKLLNELPQRLSLKKQLIENNADSIAAIHEKLKEFKTKQIPVPAAFGLKIKEYKSLVAEYSALNEQYKDLKLVQHDADVQILDLQEAIFKAKVECYSEWSDACVVKFELISPKKSFSWISKEGDVAKYLRLVREGEHDCYIKREQDDSIY